MSEPSIRELTSQIDLLRNDLASKLVGADAITELRASMAAIGDKIALLERISKLELEQTRYVSADTAGELRTALTLLTEKLAFYEPLNEIKAEQNSWKTLGKYFSITAAVIIGILGWLGVKKLESFDKMVGAEVDRRFSFYSDLSSGLGTTTNSQLLLFHTFCGVSTKGRLRSRSLLPYCLLPTQPITGMLGGLCSTGSDVIPPNPRTSGTQSHTT